MNKQRQITRFKKLAGVVVATFMTATGGAQAADKDVVNTNANWNTASDWNNGTLPADGDNIFINMSANPTKTITIASQPVNTNINEVGLARWGAGTCTVNQNTGVLTVNSWFNLGQGWSGAGTGIWNMSGNAVLNVTHSSAGQTEIGVAAGATGRLNLSGNAQFIQNRGEIRIAGEANGSGAGTTGAITLSDASMLSLANGNLVVGNVSGGFGSLTANNTSQVSVTNGTTVVGNEGGTTGTVTLADSSMFTQASYEFWIGQAGGSSGTMTMSGSSVLNLASYLCVGRAGGTGSLAVNSNAQVYAKGGELYVGTGAGSTGVLTVADSGKINSQVVMSVGGASGTGSCILSDNATINLNNELWVGNNGGSSGTMTMNGSSVLNLGNWLCVGRYWGLGTLTINGGMLNKSGGGYLGVGLLGAQGGVIQNGGYVSNAVSQVLLGSDYSGRAGIASYDLNGGVLEATSVITWSTGNSSFNFNGGTLKATSTSATFLQGLTAATVKSGSAMIDANGKNITIAQSLLDGGGGLVKLGAGMLTLSGTNTYTGTTTVSNGVLKLGVANALPSVANLTVAGGTYDLGGFTVTNGAVSLNSGRIINGTLNASAVNVSGDQIIWANLTGIGVLTKSGSGTLQMANLCGGSNVVIGGTLKIVPVPVPEVMSASLAWFDASDAATISTNAAGQVTTWANKGSAGATLDAEQIIPGVGPAVSPNALNGRSVLTVANTQSLWTKNNTGISGGQDRTLFAVGCRKNSGSMYLAHQGGLGPNNTVFGISSQNDNQYNYTWANDITMGIRTTNIYEIYDFMIASSNGTANLISGGVLASGSKTLAPNTTNDKLFLGSRPTIGSQGDLAEVILFNRALTAQERGDVEAYLQSKWFISGTPTPPPAGDVVVTSPGVLYLSAGTRTVRSLTVNGELQVRQKVYSASNLPGVLTGSGALYVTDGAAPKGTLIRIF